MTVEEKAREYTKKLVVLENKDKFSDEANLRAAQYYAYKSHLAGYNEAMRWRDPKEFGEAIDVAIVMLENEALRRNDYENSKRKNNRSYRGGVDGILPENRLG